jgi:hypothetical protein
LKKKLDKTLGAGAWNHLAPLLGQDLLRDQARLFLDDDKRSGSLSTKRGQVHLRRQRLVWSGLRELKPRLQLPCTAASKRPANSENMLRYSSQTRVPGGCLFPWGSVPAPMR